mgnify:CR=1 FL=1
MPNQSAQVIDEILRDCRTIAVVGLSSNPARPSNRVAAYMPVQGYRVIPVNPNETNVLGEPAYPSLAAGVRHNRSCEYLQEVGRRSSYR